MSIRPPGCVRIDTGPCPIHGDRITKAITVRQPWAWAIAAGHKLVENRAKVSNYRGPVAIHAGSAGRWSRTAAADPRIMAAFRPWLYPHQERIDPANHTSLFEFGKLIAVAELVDCHPAAGCCKPWGDEHAPDGRRVHHLVLENVRELAAYDRLSLRGQQSVPWNLPA